MITSVSIVLFSLIIFVEVILSTILYNYKSIDKKQRFFADNSGEYSMYGSNRKRRYCVVIIKDNPSYDSHVNIDYER